MTLSLLKRIPVLFILLFSCQTSDYENKVKEANIKSNKKGIKPQRNGREELSRAGSVKDETPTFPDKNHSEIIVYELNGHGNHSGAQSVFRQRTGNFKEIESKEVIEFLKIINNPASYGGSTAACHEPRIGLVFYKEEKPVSYLSLCLMCNNIYMKPEPDINIIGANKGIGLGFNMEARRKIRKIIKKWGFEDKSINSMFDDDETMREILRERGLGEEEIEARLSDMKDVH